MESLTDAHTWRFHRQQGSVCNGLQGLFKSPFIQEDEQLLVVLLHNKANPHRANLVSPLEQYPWISQGVNG